MNIRLIATLTTLSLTALASTSLRAEDAEVTLEWQKPGYVMDVIVVSTPRLLVEPEAVAVDSAATGEVALAWQEAGYVLEVVVATASRSEVLAAARKTAMLAALERGGSFRNGAGWSGFAARGR